MQGENRRADQTKLTQMIKLEELVQGLKSVVLVVVASDEDWK